MPPNRVPGWRGLATAWVLATAPAFAAAMTLELPATAVPSGEDSLAADQILVPTGPRTGAGGPGLVAEGQISRRAWTIPGSGLTPFQLLAPLADQLATLGYETLYTCRDRACGGFDFRLALDLLEAPAMHVDLGDFRYLAAQREGPEGAEIVILLTSRSAEAGHIHLTVVTPGDATQTLVTAATRPVVADTPASAETPSELIATLTGTGRAVLADLDFDPGSANLGEGPFASLEALSAWILADDGRSVVLVGHTDNIGALDDNIRLSERRAASVREAMVTLYDVPRARIAARGVGYLAPVAPNATQEGRQRNRRVEAVIGAP